ncbi:iron chaperone [Agromyces aerolatus]|uniref:iron chaperone n=1 Tax=Agromyces sp. LY-1074 TaxID=3074080 RepID=UPI00285F14C2|nr:MULTISPECIES: DUF1801 domain-containing protein [unclassified Agromyces]MDR5701234.1 DUF1801 domain-containing protein [Agromyces sp. LY-1074]MDR5706890.1 DUF1801 domain-containing protein [Agromyces sp. LY-1358]
MGALSDYIGSLDPAERDALERIRVRALELVPDAEEGMGYGMPALTYRGRPLLSVRATKTHLGYYPFSSDVIDRLRDDLEGLDWSKGTIRFRPEHPLPAELVSKLILLRRDEIDAATIP